MTNSSETRSPEDLGTPRKPMDNPSALVWIVLIGLPLLLLFMVLYKANMTY